MSLRVAIVDDEPIARRRVRRLLASIPSVEVVGEASNGREALACVTRTGPDVVLLDVEMPEVDGFDVARQLPSPRPWIVFLTAYDKYALAAFEVHALDYVLKPVSRERLARAIGRAMASRVRESNVRDASLIRALEQIARDRRFLRRLPVRSRGRVEMVEVDSVDWIASADNYVVLHVGRTSFLLRETLKALERQLDPNGFLRIHRSTIVQLSRIERLETEGRGDYRVVLRDGTRLSLSRTYRPKLQDALGREF